MKNIVVLNHAINNIFFVFIFCVFVQPIHSNSNIAARDQIPYCNLTIQDIDNANLLTNILNLKNDNDFLRCVESLYILYIADDFHNNKIYNLIVKIINNSHSRILSYSEFVYFLQRILKISNNRHNSQSLLINMIENFKFNSNKTEAQELNKNDLYSLYTAAFSNDNPSVIQFLIDKHIISNKDNVDVLSALFNSHAIKYTKFHISKVKEETEMRQCDSSLPQIHRGSMFMTSRHNGIRIAHILKSYNYRFINSSKYLLLIRNPSLIPDYGSKYELQDEAESLFLYVAEERIHELEELGER